MYLVNIGCKKVTCKRHIYQLLRYTNKTNVCQTSEVGTPLQHEQPPYYSPPYGDLDIHDRPDNDNDKDGVERPEGDIWEDAVATDTDKTTAQVLGSEAPTEQKSSKTTATDSGSNKLPAESPPQSELPYALRLRPRLKSKKHSYKI